jgi:hypothetical protein
VTRRKRKDTGADAQPAAAESTANPITAYLLGRPGAQRLVPGIVLVPHDTADDDDQEPEEPAEDYSPETIRWGKEK